MSTESRDIQDWLATATRGLAEESVGVLREDIVSHYEEAVRFYQEQGRQPTDAQRMALRDLGDARKARRRFLRLHDTA